MLLTTLASRLPCVTAGKSKRPSPPISYRDALMPDQEHLEHAKLVDVARHLSQVADYLAGQIKCDSTEDAVSDFLRNGFAKNGLTENKIRLTRPPLPAPNLIRKILKRRVVRGKFFDSFSEDLFRDPAWDMLLDLTLAHTECRRVSVTSLCIASGVPPTTALRWIRAVSTRTDSAGIPIGGLM